jgi:hypothetical protein
MKLIRSRLINLSVCALACLFFGVRAQEEKNVFSDEHPKGFSVFGEQLSGGSLSAENKQYVTEIFKKMGKSPSRFCRTLESFSESYPGFRYIFASPFLGYCYINEAWFNTLSEPEKRFVVGRAALDSTNTTDLKSSLVYAGVAGTGCYLGYKLYTTLGEYNRGFLVKSLSTIAALALYTKIADKVVMQPLARYNEYKKDKQAALHLDCVDGALIVLKKMDDKAMPIKSIDRVNRLKVLKKVN